MKTWFSLSELTHREFPVSCTGFGFAVQVIWIKSIAYFLFNFMKFKGPPKF